MSVDVTDTLSHQAILFDKKENFFIGGFAGAGQITKKIQNFTAIAQIAAGQFTDHERVYQHAGTGEQINELSIS
jgi:hypothetical protein